MTDLNRPIGADALGITLKDVLNMYLREVETLQKTMIRLERRIERDIDRIDTDIRQYGVTTREDINLLRDEVAAMRDHMSSLELNVSELNNTLSTMISDAESRRKDADHEHALQIRELQLKSGVIGGGAGGLIATCLPQIIELVQQIIN